LNKAAVDEVIFYDGICVNLRNIALF